jgi:hypothetical protein
VNSSAPLLPSIASTHQNQANAPHAPDAGDPNAALGSGSQAMQAADTTALGTTPGTASGMPMARAPFHQAKHNILLFERLFTTLFVNSEPMEPQINNIVSITH